MELATTGIIAPGIRNCCVAEKVLSIFGDKNRLVRKFGENLDAHNIQLILVFLHLSAIRFL